MVEAEAQGAPCRRGAGAAGGGTALRRTGPVRPPARRGDCPVPGHPGGGAHSGRRHLEAGAAVRRGGGEVCRPESPAGAGGLFPYRGHRLGTAGDSVLSGPVSGRLVYLRPRAGGDCSDPRRDGDCRPAVRRPGAGGGEDWGQPPGLSAVQGGAGGESGAALSGAAPLYPLPAHGRRPLRGVAAAVHALFGRYSAENLSGHRSELGAGG